MVDLCERCEGRGWVGDATAGQFPYLGKLALRGMLPTKTCSACNGAGYKPLTEGKADD